MAKAKRVKKKVGSAGKKIRRGASTAKKKAADNWKWILIVLFLLVLLLLTNINRIQFTFL